MKYLITFLFIFAFSSESANSIRHIEKCKLKVDVKKGECVRRLS